MKVEIYSTDNCVNCKTAVDLTNGYVDEMVVLKANTDFTIPELFQRVGKRVASFPQIFVDGEYIGTLSDYEPIINELRTKSELEDLDDEDFEI